MITSFHVTLFLFSLLFFSFKLYEPRGTVQLAIKLRTPTSNPTNQPRYRLAWSETVHVSHTWERGAEADPESADNTRPLTHDMGVQVT
jgi:hypothetical protein